MARHDIREATVSLNAEFTGTTNQVRHKLTEYPQELEIYRQTLGGLWRMKKFYRACSHSVKQW